MLKELSSEEVRTIDGGGICGAVIGFGLGLGYGAVIEAFSQQSGKTSSEGAIGRILWSGVKAGGAGVFAPI